MVPRRSVRDARLQAGGARAVRPAEAWRPDRPVTLAVGLVPDGSSDSAACNPADRLADHRGGMAHRQAGNHGDAGGNTASQGVRRQPADSHAPVRMERPSHAVIMRHTYPPGPACAAHLRDFGHFKATIDRIGVGLQS